MKTKIILLIIITLSTSNLLGTEYLVKISSNGLLDTASNIKKIPGTSSVENLGLSFGNFFKVKQSYAIKNSFYQQALNSLPGIEYIEENVELNFMNNVVSNDIDLFSNEISDLKFKKQWGLRNIGQWIPGAFGKSGTPGVDISAIKAWSITKGSKNIKIAVLDTGVELNHPDLKDNIFINLIEANGKPNYDDDGNGYIDDINGYDFANNDNDPSDDNGHGTHCAGIIGASHNNFGIAGVMNKVSIIPIKFMSKKGVAKIEDAVKAIDYAIKIKADIMSNSWGNSTYSEAIKDAIRASNEQGIVFVAASGNNGRNSDLKPLYPANYGIPNIVAVASHNWLDNFSYFANYGLQVNITAPGEKIYSTIRNGRYGVMSGTSMAAPHVSGAIGLLLTINPNLEVEEILHKIETSATNSTNMLGRTTSNGRLNLYNLLTDTQIDKNPANNLDWEEVILSKIIESDHPYRDTIKYDNIITVPGAKFIRVIIDKWKMEYGGYDVFIISNPENGQHLDYLGEMGENYKSVYVRGNSIKVEIDSDGIYSDWGYQISKVEVIR